MHRSDAHGPSPDRGSLVDGDPHGLPVGGGLERAIGVDGPGKVIVGQRDRRADEDAVGQAGRFVHKGVVLHLAAVPHDDALADVGASAHDAVPSEDGVLTDLGKVPDAGAISEDGVLGDISGRGDSVSHGDSCAGGLRPP